MDINTIGVISTPDGRTLRDMQMLQNFSCKRPNQMGDNIIGNGTVVLGSNIEERSGRDRQMLSEFSCSREGYVGPDGMIYPRSVMDRVMLKEFNRCGDQVENYRCPCGCGGDCRVGCGCPRGCPCYQNVRENYCGSGGINFIASNGPNINGNGPFAQLNFNPYNSSSNINYVPLGQGLQ
jgi:hypothetical protein